ncbi:hypothetical protein BX666DRAFT_2022361 [Dichotomocladium elegans]|nr:hypothetical protein BX666DRAFT_2022361 [Dichotomocladium elegans]
MKNKSKFVIGDEAMSPLAAGITSSVNPAAAVPNSGSTRRPVMHRHHVKRRSLGHARIRPLSGKQFYGNNNSLTDAEADEEEDHVMRSTPLRRSQSQRSLRRMDMLQPIMPLTQPRESAVRDSASAFVSPSPSCLHGNISGSNSRVNSATSYSPSLLLSATPSVIAEPIEQPLHAMANNLVGPDIQGGAYTAAQEAITMRTSPYSTAAAALVTAPAAPCRSTLRSQFITRQHGPFPSGPAGLVDREYISIREHRDPMAESFIRCARKKSRIPVSRTLSTSALRQPSPSPHHPLAMLLQGQQEHQQQNPPSSSSSSSSPLLQRQRQCYDASRSLSSNPVNSSGILGIRWGAAAGTLWGRMMHGL